MQAHTLSFARLTASPPGIAQASTLEANMKLGLRPILLLAAIVLFIAAALSSTNEFDLIAYGLACTAGALLVEGLGLGRGLFGKR